MANFLGFDRSTSEVVVVDTVGATITPLGPALTNIETTVLFPRRSQNLNVIFQGVAYNMSLRTDNTIIVHCYDGAAWQPRMQYDSGLANGLKPLGLHVSNDRIVALWVEVSPGGRVFGASSLDGTTWTSGTVSVPLPADITTNALVPGVLADGGGHSIEWNGAVFFCTSLGIGYYKPSLDTFGPFYDAGGALATPETATGCFTRWQTNLYFVLPGTPTPRLYKLTNPFVPLSDPVAPQFTDQSVTGLSDPGAISTGPDDGMASLFVTPSDELGLFYTGATATYYAKTTIGTFPIFQDQGTVNFPAGVSALTNAGLSLLNDERRLTRTAARVVANDTATGDLQFLDVEGTTTIVSSTIAGAGNDLILPQSQRAKPIYMMQEPAVFISTPIQLFPGNYSIPYTLIDVSSRTMDILPEYTIDGVTWRSMTQGDTGEDTTGLTSSPAGVAHTFNWDARQDLNGTTPFQNFRIVGRIASV